MKIKSSSELVRNILQAAADGNIGELDRVPSGKQLQSYRCISGCSALHWAAGSNEVATVRYLVYERQVPVDILATKKSKGRTPLHYAARNGCLDATKCLVEELGANVNALANHGVSAFQLAVWQNHLHICKYLVHECQVNPAQLNDFDCGAVHWIGLAPAQSADGPQSSGGELLLPLAKWLASLDGVDFTLRQRQGHSALHKAAWGGHTALLRWLHSEIGLWDDTQDLAGNFAADLADMANTDRHRLVAAFLRQECSPARAESCNVLGVSVVASSDEIRKAYLLRAKQVHPDRFLGGEKSHDFDQVRQAYDHLSNENGIGKQSNPAHSLRLMLELSGEEVNPDDHEANDKTLFKARLIAVLLEYGEKGLDLSNVRRKWTQVWPDIPYPWEIQEGNAVPQPRRKGVLLDYIRQYASDVVDIVTPNEGGRSTLIVPKRFTQEHVALAALKRDVEAM